MDYPYYARLLAIVLAMIISEQVVAQEANCGFLEMLNRQLGEDTLLIQRFAEINLRLEKALRKDENAISFRNEATIPIVVHVVWNSPEENVSDLTIVEQIAILNRDFNHENSDLENVPDEFKPYMAKKGIRFCLASVDPMGLPTSGIIRVKTEVEAVGTKEDLFYSSLGGSDAWDTERYLNIWVANTGLSDGDVFGSYYHLNESDGVEDYIEIRSYNTSTRAISGYFQASLYKDDRVDYDLLRPDTLVIKEGYFETIVQDRL